MARRLLCATAFLLGGLGASPAFSRDELEGVRSVTVVRRDEPIYTEPSKGAARRGAAARDAQLPVFQISRGGGCTGRWFAVGPIAWICEEGVAASAATAPPEAPRAVTAEGMPYAYYFVGRDGTFGYSDLLIAEEGVPDAQLLSGFGVAVTREGVKPGGERFGLTTHGLWVPLRDLRRALPPTFRGSVLTGPLSVAWVNQDRVRLRAAPAAPPKGDIIPRQTRLRIVESSTRAGKTWLRVDEDQWLLETEVARPTLAARPPEVKQTEHWFDVELASQTVTAYVGEQPVLSTLVSTGRGRDGSELATPKGRQRIWVKLVTSDMDNLENVDATDAYAIQAVPWVMYFHKGIGLHGTFWHRAFGRAQSHGCVNLSPADAERLFDWASPRLPSGWSAVLPTVYEPGSLVQVR